MHASAQKEQFSLAYVHAVATVAGFDLGRFNVDDDSVDVVLKASDRLGDLDGLHLSLQLKCTQNLAGNADNWSFRLKRKNYEDLRRVSTHLQTLLVVLHVPVEVDEWLQWGPDEMTLKRRAYWVSIRGRPTLPPGQASATVQIPRRNVFDVAGLRAVAEKMARDEAL